MAAKSKADFFTERVIDVICSYQVLPLGNNSFNINTKFYNVNFGPSSAPTFYFIAYCSNISLSIKKFNKL